MTNEQLIAIETLSLGVIRAGFIDGSITYTGDSNPVASLNGIEDELWDIACKHELGGIVAAMIDGLRTHYPLPGESVATKGN